MEIINKKISELKPYKNNPRNNKEAVKYVANSIKEFGFKVPIIIDKNAEIIAGHTRLEASKELGLKEVPCIIADDLTEEQVKAFRLADNKVSEIAEWDFGLLGDELDDILNYDMSDFGFIDKEIKINEKKEEKEVEFSEILLEEHNYIVLYFDNEIDWLQAESLFDIKKVKCGATRRDGKIKGNMKRIGVGRVLKGREAIEKILEGKNENKNMLS